MEGTIFEYRLADGRNGGTGETATKAIVDLSTMEQMLLNVISCGKHKSEQFKHHYIPHFLPYAQEFLNMLEELFAKDWIEEPPSDKDPFRRLYVHGWPFCLKALASLITSCLTARKGYQGRILMKIVVLCSFKGTLKV